MDRLQTDAGNMTQHRSLAVNRNPLIDWPLPSDDRIDVCRGPRDASDQTLAIDLTQLVNQLSALREEFKDPPIQCIDRDLDLLRIGQTGLVYGVQT